MAIIALILLALKIIIFADIIFSWVMPDDSRFPRSLTSAITTPLYAPIHAVLKPEKLGGIDISPLLILLLIHFMESMLARAAY
jgi:uncharacterized protein YggT (Ycf19 family)